MGDVNLEIKLNNLKENVSDINKRAKPLTVCP